MHAHLYLYITHEWTDEVYNWSFIYFCPLLGYQDILLVNDSPVSTRQAAPWDCARTTLYICYVHTMFPGHLHWIPISAQSKHFTHWHQHQQFFQPVGDILTIIALGFDHYYFILFLTSCIAIIYNLAFVRNKLLVTHRYLSLDSSHDSSLYDIHFMHLQLFYF